MHRQTLAAFADELEKISFISPAADLAGLGILAVPGVKHLMKKPKGTAQDKKERNTAKYETAGLATLGGSVLAKDHHELGAGLKKGIGAAKNFAGKALRHA
jgi:hypothetical protein